MGNHTKNSSYTTLPLTLVDNGKHYRCIVTINDVSITSDSALLEVIVNPTITITQQPLNVTLYPNNKATFNVTATTTNGTLMYQWQSANVGSINFSNIIGAIDSSYTTPTTALLDNNKQYKCIVSVNGVSVVSSVALLKVSVTPTIIITQQPITQSLYHNSIATFNITAVTTTGTLTYQWQSASANSTSFTNIGNAKTSSYTTLPLTILDNNKQYRCIVSVDGVSVTSSIATFTIRGVISTIAIIGSSYRTSSDSYFSYSPRLNSMGIDNKGNIYYSTYIITALGAGSKQTNYYSCIDIIGAVNKKLAGICPPYTDDVFSYRVLRYSNINAIYSVTYNLVNEHSRAQQYAGYGGDGGSAVYSKFSEIFGIAVDSAGNIYIADTGNNRIRKIDTNNIINTIAGGGAPVAGSNGDGGYATNASLSRPSGIALDSSGNIYIADTGNNRIRKIDVEGIISTIAGGGAPVAGSNGDGGYATNASLSRPSGIVLDSSGNIYIADTGNNRIRKIDVEGIISTIAGGGAPVAGSNGDGGYATNAGLSSPSGIALDSNILEVEIFLPLINKIYILKYL